MFRRSDAQREWFQKIGSEAPFRVDFDQWYLCFLLGIVTGRKEQLESGKDLVDYFVEDYKLVQNLIVGMLIIAELKSLEIDMSEKAAVRGQIERLLDSREHSSLTAEGIQAANAYAEGGFRYLKQQVGDLGRPEDTGIFLIKYSQYLEAAVAQSAFCK